MDYRSRYQLAGVIFVVASLIAILPAVEAFAQVPSASEIIDALRFRGTTRGPAPSFLTPEQRQLIEKLRTEPTATHTDEERRQMLDLAKGKPNISLETQFEVGSTTVDAKGIPVLNFLGTALRSDELQGVVILLAVQADTADGLALSEHRAEAVKGYLIREFGLASQNMVAVGYGTEQLKNQPEAKGGDNRPVQVVNLGLR